MQKKEQPLPAVILAGGLGTRLRSAYSAGPKSMAPIGERPFLDYLLSWLQSQGVKEVILCVGYKRSHIHRFVGSGHKWGMRVKYSVEQRLLGTGGALKKARRFISSQTMLVLNGDTFVEVSLRKLTRFHLSRKAFATLVAVRVADRRRYGSLRLNRRGRITAFLEKSGRAIGAEGGDYYINAGIYIFDRRLLGKIRNGGPVSLEKEVFPSLLSEKNVYGFASDAYFLDIGVPDELRRAQRELPQRIRVSHTR